MLKDKLEKYIKIAAFIWLLLIIAIVLSNYLDPETKKPAFCFTNKCMDDLYIFFKAPIEITKTLFKLAIPILTITTILIAIENFNKSRSEFSITRHLTTYNTFVNFVDSEISNFSTINSSSINKVAWFEMMYQNPHQNNFDTSKEYIELISEINSNIKESNTRYNPGKSTDFKYKYHQSKMRRTLIKIGIDIEHGPRLEFFEVESEVVLLIRKTNVFFHNKNQDLEIINQNYT